MKSRSPLLSNARAFRKRSTDAELLLWQNLRSRQLDGIKFKRQERLEGYIVDFVALAPKVVVELDGSQHAESIEYDAIRDSCLRRNGFVILRFWDNDVLKNLRVVLEVIQQHCAVAASPSPQPSPARGEGEFERALKVNGNR